jgi:hypothetical protein
MPESRIGSPRREIIGDTQAGVRGETMTWLNFLTDISFLLEVPAIFD